MKTKVVLFDLDGTLLPMDQEQFTKYYFGLLAKRLAPLGYNPDQLIDGIWKGTAAMIKNNGDKSNEAVFWDTFSALLGEHVRKDEPEFDAYYRTDFQNVKASCGFHPLAAEAVAKVKSMGLRTVLATNPIFPAVATESRMAWAGLNPADFELYTTYENSCHSKPNPAYYQDILEKLGVSAEECLMVGNDVGEDMVAAKLGMKVFLLTDCLINKDGSDISLYPNGGFEELLSFLDRL